MHFTYRRSSALFVLHVLIALVSEAIAGDSETGTPATNTAGAGGYFSIPRPSVRHAPPRLAEGTGRLAHDPLLCVQASGGKPPNSPPHWITTAPAALIWRQGGWGGCGGDGGRVAGVCVLVCRSSGLELVFVLAERLAGGVGSGGFVIIDYHSSTRPPTASNTMVSFMVLREDKRRRCMMLICGGANRPDPSRNQGDYEGVGVGEGGGSEADMHGLSVSLTRKECFT